MYMASRRVYANGSALHCQIILRHNLNGSCYCLKALYQFFPSLFHSPHYDHNARPYSSSYEVEIDSI